MKSRIKNIFLFLFLVYFGIGKLNCQTNKIDSLKAELEKLNQVTGKDGTLSDTNKLLLLDDITHKLGANGSNKEAMIYALKEKEFAENLLKSKNMLGDKKILKQYLAYSYNNIAVNQFNEGNYVDALKNQISGFELKKEIGDKRGMGGSCVNIANIYYMLGNYPECLKSVLRGLKFYEEVSSDGGMAFCYNTIGAVYLSQDNRVEAMKNFEAALKIREKLKDKYNIAMLRNNIAIIQKKSGDYDHALKNYLLSLNIRTELEDKSGMGACNINIGELFIKQKKLSEAMLYLERALSLKKEINDQDGMVTCYLNISEVYYLQKKYKDASSFSNMGLEISKKTGSIDNIRLGYEMLARINEASGDFKKAHEYFKQFIIYRDSLNNEENTNKLMKTQMQYDFDKKIATDSIKSLGEKKIFEVQLKEEKTKQIALYSGLVLVAFLAIFMFNRFRVTQKQKAIIELQKIEVEKQKEIVEYSHDVIEEKQKEIVDSINYAKRIQYGLLANHDLVDQFIPQNFILFKPKDIVSGDFYWATLNDDRFYLAVCDSTGHGVPGAFMCLLNMGFLTEAINEKNIVEPNEIFNYVRQRLISSIGKDGQRDGFDGILLCFNHGTGKITYSAANNAPVIVRNGTILEMDCDKMPVGRGERDESFKNYKIETQKGDGLYLYTDGFADQFGGPKGKKFKYKPLNQLLIDNSNLPMVEQNEILLSTFEHWRGQLEQVDDVCIIGIKI